jgi:hypothetical protein
MLTATYEPQAPSETPLLAEVAGCGHADMVMIELDGGPKLLPWGSLALWDALLREVEQYCLDQYTDALEYRMDHQRSLREEP